MTNKNYDGDRFANKVEDFSNPTQLPENEDQAMRWQQANKRWWENSPMRYDWRDQIVFEKGSKEYFDEIDRRFFSTVREYMPWQDRPFDNLLDFADLKSKDVLEIGVGHGSHAQLIATHCHSFTGIDLTETAIGMTQQRFSVNGLLGDIKQMDAEKMVFPSNSFDLVWSWGVIHHSANTDKIIQEISRVLRPGGCAVLMVYHRSPWRYYVYDGFFKGILRGELFRTQGGLHGVSQSQTDGAIARFYTVSEWKDQCTEILPVTAISVTGQKIDVVPLPKGKLRDLVCSAIPDAVSQFLTNNLKFGSFLISEHRAK